MPKDNKTKSEWERGKDALYVIMGWIPTDQLEAFATMINEQKFRNSCGYKAFINQLKKKANGTKVT